MVFKHFRFLVFQAFLPFISVPSEYHVPATLSRARDVHGRSPNRARRSEMNSMKEIGRIVAVVLALTCAVAVVSLPGMDADTGTDGTDITGQVIGEGFDWTSIAAETDYVIETEVVMGPDVKGVTIPETTTITIMDGGCLTFEDCTATISGEIRVLPGGCLVISSTGLELGGSIVADAGSTVHLKIDSIGQEYDFLAPTASDDTIFTLVSGSLSIRETLNGFDEETYGFTLDGIGSFDMIDIGGGIVSYELVITEGSELTVVDDFEEEGVIENSGTLIIAPDVTVSHEGYGFDNDGALINNGVLNVMYDTVESAGSIENNGTISFDSDADAVVSGDFVNNGTVIIGEATFTNNGIMSGPGLFQGTVTGSGTIGQGVFTTDVSPMCADGKTAYAHDTFYVVSMNDIEDAQLIIADIPFGTVEDALALINMAGDFAEAEGDTLILIDDLADTDAVTLVIPEGAGMTLDLNGHRMVLGNIVVNGAMNVADTLGEGSLTASNIDIAGGSIAGSGVIAASENVVNLVDIIGSGSISGVTLDVSDAASNGGAINLEVGLTGSAVINGVTIFIDDADAVTDRGIYVNQMPETGSVVIGNVVFDFNGNDACPLNVDVDGNTDMTVSDLEYRDCARTNKVVMNSVGDATIGSDGGIRMTDVSDVVLWDASGSGKTFTVAGELIINGRMAVTSAGNLVIPDDSEMTVNGSIELSSDSSIEGTILFGSDGSSSIKLNDVVAGADGLRLSLGSVVISGTVASGSMSLNGTGTIGGELDLGESELAVPEGSVLNVPRDASVSGSTAIVVEGKMNVYGTMAAPVQNDGQVYVIGNGEVIGAVMGNDVQEKEDEPLSIDFIPDMKWTVGETKSIPLGIHPIDAEITGITGADWLTFDGHVITGAPTEAGTYEILLTVGLDGETVQDTFVITVTETPVDDEPGDDDSPIDWKLIAVILLIVVIAILVLRMFLS